MKRNILILGNLWLLVTSETYLVAADFSVSTPNGQYAFRINGQDNPTLTLQRGNTYTFAVATDFFHPFALGDDDAGYPFGPTPTGVAGDNINFGTVTFAVPADAQDCGYYCSYHYFYGLIHFVDPPAPPRFQILSLSLGTNLVVKSTGTNTWTPFPEYSTNLSTTNWYALTVQSNRITAGTNETFCGRPPGSPVFIRVRSQAN